MLLVMKAGMLPVLVGIGVGAAGALALTRLIESFLFGIKPSDPASFVFASTTFCSVALLACYRPARRAMRVDPVVALRHE
jgi:ABC-type antimicrobial peptide transport system permease subunit